MEENRLMTHNWNSRKPTSQIPASLSIEPNNNTQECRSPNGKGKAIDDKANDPWLVAPEEGRNDNGKVEAEARIDESGRERLKRHREEVIGQVNVPENWGQEQLLKDWIDYTTFDALLAPHRLIITARDALIADGRKASQRLRIHSSC